MSNPERSLFVVGNTLIDGSSIAAAVRTSDPQGNHGSVLIWLMGMSRDAEPFRFDGAEAETVWAFITSGAPRLHRTEIAHGNT